MVQHEKSKDCEKQGYAIPVSFGEGMIGPVDPIVCFPRRDIFR